MAKNEGKNNVIVLSNDRDSTQLMVAEYDNNAVKYFSSEELGLILVWWNLFNEGAKRIYDKKPNKKKSGSNLVVLDSSNGNRWIQKFAEKEISVELEVRLY